MDASRSAFFDHLAKHYASRAPKKALEALRRFLGPDRAALPPDYMSQAAFLDVYQRYYLPLHLPELPWIFTQAARFGLRPKSGSTVLDLGSGPGTLSLAMALWSQQQGLQDLSFTLVDRSASALDLAASLFKIAAPRYEAHFAPSDLSRPASFRGSDRFDWILAGHMLNEWGTGSKGLTRKKDFLDAVLRHVMHESSVLVIVEPPLREATTDLMRLRDFWVQELGGEVLLPCPSGTERCPALKARLGWCYSKVPRTWAREQTWAPLDKQVEAFLGQELHYNGFSYLLLASPGADRTSFGNPAQGRRVGFSDERRRPSLWCRNGRMENSTRRPKHRGELL